MRFEIAHASPSGACHRVQPAQLIEHVRAQIVRRDIDEAAAKTGEISVTHLRSDDDTVGGCRRASALQGQRVTGVKATRHIGRGDHTEQCIIVAESPATEGLAEVGIEVDKRHTATVGAGARARQTSARLAEETEVRTDCPTCQNWRSWDMWTSPASSTTCRTAVRCSGSEPADR